MHVTSRLRESKVCSDNELMIVLLMDGQVSLLEYRKRLKDKTGPTCNSSNNATSLKSSPRAGNPGHRSTLDNPVTLAPLPLFEPLSVTREMRGEHLF